MEPLSWPAVQHPDLPIPGDADVGEWLLPLSWPAVQHPDLPVPGDANVGEWLLGRADESLLLAGVVALPVLSDAGAERLADLTRRLVGAGGDGVGSMHHYATDLLDAGVVRAYPELPALLCGLVGALTPVIAAAFLPGMGDGSLVLHSAHCIGYGLGPMREKALRLHVDDSTVTVNVCLGVPGFRGSNLQFQGIQPVEVPVVAKTQRRRQLLRRELDTVEVAATPQPGYAMIHRGAHPHRTEPICAGERFNWVLWLNLLPVPPSLW